MNISFLNQIMTSGCYYWLIAKKNEGFRGERYPDYIFLAGIPRNGRPYKRNEIKVVEMDEFRRMEIPANIFFSEKFPPFQLGQSLYNAYQGIPLENVDIPSFMIDALQLNSNKLGDYEPLIKKHTKEIQ